eukprot:scaffold83818_cov35-Tisochrysis_lutea.AAC.8
MQPSVALATAGRQRRRGPSHCEDRDHAARGSTNNSCQSSVPGPKKVVRPQPQLCAQNRRYSDIVPSEPGGLSIWSVRVTPSPIPVVVPV